MRLLRMLLAGVVPHGRKRDGGVLESDHTFDAAGGALEAVEKNRQ
jgi:hypothetical protein